MRLWIDKIASATANVPLKRDARISPQVLAREGQIVAGRIHGEKSSYNTLEDTHGRMMTLHNHDVIAGVLGRRNALHGYAGFVPEQIAVGDTLQLLNLGGVLGRCTSVNPDLGQPFDLEVLGSVLVFPEFENRAGVPAHIGMNALAAEPLAGPLAPLIYIAGTCMNSGKTEAACRLIRRLAQHGLAVGACKLTGVSLRRDTLQMRDYGASWALSFNDAGIVTTSPETAVDVARAVLARLTRLGAHVIVAELGDGLLGEYGVAEILASRPLVASAAAFVLCATDPVGAWGGQRVMREQLGLEVDVVSGPTTDNAVGSKAIRERLGVPAINARADSEAFGRLLIEKLEAKALSSQSGAPGERA